MAYSFVKVSSSSLLKLPYFHQLSLLKASDSVAATAHSA